jgi:hypothetical protein
MNQLLLQFSYLQVLDFLTTIAFLLNGVQEANPIVKTAIAVSASPLAGLLAVKLIALMLGWYCWRLGKNVVLARTNMVFAALVAWNLIALIVRTAV